MSNFNLIVIEGRLTKDANFSHTSRGTAMLKFSIANNYYKKENGERKEAVMFFNIIAWEKLAEIMSPYLKKGMPIIVSGKIVIDDYTDQNGAKKKWIQVVANNIEFLSGAYSSKKKGNPDNKIPY